MPIATVPAEFGKLGTVVAIVSDSGVTKATITKITKTQVTVEARNYAGKMAARRFYDDQRGSHGGQPPTLVEVGYGSVYHSGPRLMLQTDPRARKAAEDAARHQREIKVRRAAEAFMKSKLTSEDVARMMTALSVFEDGNTPGE